jgi:serine/threonine-protein kinase
MSTNSEADSASLPLSLERQVNAACRHFEAAWRAGGRPRIEDYLADGPEPARQALLAELLALELAYRGVVGEAPDAEEYRARLPGHGAIIHEAFRTLDPSIAPPPPASEGATVPEEAPRRAGAGRDSPPVVTGRDPGTGAGPPSVPDLLSKQEAGGMAPYTDLRPNRPTGADPLRTVPCEPLSARPKSLSEIAPGTMLLNRYGLERLLGQGGMGQVYLARDALLQRPVAAKLIRPLDPRLRDRSLHEASLREAFSEEARIGANLTHPAIATVFDFGFHDGEPFIVFEYIAGETLRDVIRERGCLPLEEARLILGPLAQALHFAHSYHVVHRDLKPENIRATAQGHFKILDLGLAKEFRNQIDWTFAGTPAYASPEQAAGLPCDGRTDQYALALIAHEMLTGRRLFEQLDWSELLRMHREQEPPSPRRFVPDLPESVCMALLRALQKDPNRRFASCEEFAVALGCQLLNAPIPRAEILRLTSVVRMWGDWTSSRFRAIRQGTAVYLVVSPDALWAAYRGELRRWPVQTMTELRRNRWGDELHLRFERPGHGVRQAFKFASRDECRQWYELLQDLKSRLPTDLAAPDEWPQVELAVMMRRPPEMRYQSLGGVEFQDVSRRRAEVGLQVRAALMGADAVVDVQEERLPRPGRTIHRRSGMAIRAVDTAGRWELHSRWFATQVSQLGFWMLMLVGISFVCTSLGSLLYNFLPSLVGIGSPLQPGETVWHRLGVVALTVVAIHVWPFAITLLVRCLLWPQFVRPAALAVLALGAKPFTCLLGWLTAGLVAGRWGGMALAVTLLDPVNLGLLVFAWFLARKAWRADHDYRRLAPEAGQQIPWGRRVSGSGGLALSVVFALVLWGWLAWGNYFYVSHFVLPGTHAWKEQEALRHLHEGIMRGDRQPREAEGEFLRALPLWEELVETTPARPEYRHNLAVTCENLGDVLMRRGEAAEAEAFLRQALTHHEKLDSAFPTYREHKKDREWTQRTLALLVARKPFLQDAAETREGYRLATAGQHRAAVELYRQALARHERLGNEFPNEAAYLRLLAIKQNRLAWFLVVCPDMQVRDPKQAVELAGRAVENAPQEGSSWNTLGAAHFRSGNWNECVIALEKSMQLGRGGDGFDWLFLAMAYHRLGKADDANKWLDKSLDWLTQMDQGRLNDPLLQVQWQSLRHDAELLRDEAEGLIRPKQQRTK